MAGENNLILSPRSGLEEPFLFLRRKESASAERKEAFALEAEKENSAIASCFSLWYSPRSGLEPLTYGCPKTISFCLEKFPSGFFFSLKAFLFPKKKRLLTVHRSTFQPQEGLPS